jgi:hypothetical protein
LFPPCLWIPSSIDSIPRQELSEIEGKIDVFEMVRLELVEHVANGQPVTHGKPECSNGCTQENFFNLIKRPFASVILMESQGEFIIFPPVFLASPCGRDFSE